MKKVEIKVPRMGESITEVTVSKILKETNSLVKVDEEILEVETDKLNQVIYAPAAGVLTISVKQGDIIKVNEIIGSIEVKEGEAPKKEKVSEEISTIPKKEIPIPPKEELPTTPIRIEKEKWVTEIKEEVVEEPKLDIGIRKETRRKMSAIRKVIASRLVLAKQETAMLTTFNEVDMTHIIAIREKYQESFQKKHGVKLGFMSFFVKACTIALQEFPLVNSYISQDDLVYRNYIDIGIAVSTDRGLIVPVLRNCEHLTYNDVEKKIIDFSKRAKTGDLSVDELQGGGFTITNGGVFGSLLSTPILNPPQCAILGMHKIMKRPICVGDEIVARPMMYLALSYDHRVLDGREAVTFLVRIKELIEDSERMSLDV